MRFLLLILLLHHTREIYTNDCEVKPKGASGKPNENSDKFIIEIATTPEKYIPDKSYNVTLSGRNGQMGESIQFNGFSITVQSSNMDEISPILDQNVTGVLDVYPGDTTAKIDEKCSNVVVHTSHTFVSEVIVQWTAPPAGKPCVLFRASVMEQNIWYRNNRSLTIYLCEDDSIKSEDDVKECETCHEAKYELKFEGMWTRRSHPLYFPSNVWKTRFSDVIGASHGTSYRLWKTNDPPSQGLIEFLEMGNTTTLETEIKSNETRTIIKAKGLGHPNINSKTFAVFRVDKNHHLLSIISLIIPSPDWFVGVSGLELCNKTEWIPDKIIDLYPYDLGLYADLQYTSRTKNTSDKITKIDHATEYESPFHTNNTEKLKPLARIYLTRSRVYERLCNVENAVYTTPRDQTGCVDGNCSSCYLNIDSRMKWSGCSTPECDNERVKIKFPDGNDDFIKECNMSGSLNEQIRIDSCFSQCSSKEEERLSKMRFQLKASCPTSEWSPFSACDSKTCYRYRNRTLLKDADRQNSTCLKLIFKQKIKCDECFTDDQQANTD